jgi:RNA polymerase sigma-70 factor (ECF subfamily)
MQDFAEQVAAQRPLLVKMARLRLRNDAWAEDAVSETLVAALENGGTFAGRASMQTWLVGILKHKLVDQIRRHTRERQFDEPDDALETGETMQAATRSVFDISIDRGDPQERLMQRQFIEHVDRCLKTLPPRQERAFVLRDWMAEDTDAICAELGVTANHLAVILHRARSGLRASMRTQGFDAGRAAQPPGASGCSARRSGPSTARRRSW